MRLQKQLNINNTFRVLNINFFTKDDFDIVKVLPKDKNKILESLNNTNDNLYWFDSKYPVDMELTQKILNHKPSLVYHTDSTVKISTMLDIGTNRKAVYLYDVHKFDDNEIKDIQTASICGVSALLLKDVDHNTDMLDTLFSIDDVRYLADRLYITFKPDVDLDYRIKVFEHWHEILARWTIQLYVQCENDEQKEHFQEYLLNNYK